MKSVCVFAGSSPGSRPAYAEAAVGLGHALAERDLTLVYGGGNCGLMGVLADAALARGGRVIGVIPRALVQREVAHHGVTELLVVDSMHERKACMDERSDAVVALPGGLGTLEELFEMLTWSQLGLHAKPCGLLDVEGYYGSLRAFLDHCEAERFLAPEHRSMLLCETGPEALLERLAGWQAPAVEKWLDREDV